MKLEAGRRGELAAGLCSADTPNLRLLCQLASFGALGSTGDLAGPCPLRSGWELALFGRGLLRIRFVTTPLPQSTCPFSRSGGNWVRFARLSLSGAGLGDLAGPRLPRPAREIGFVSHDYLQHRQYSQPSRAAPFRPGRGKLGSFGTMHPSDGSAGASPAWARLCPCRQLASFVPAVPATVPPATSPVPARSCHCLEIGFVSHVFVRSTAFTRIGPVFPGNADLPIGIRKQPIRIGHRVPQREILRWGGALPNATRPFGDPDWRSRGTPHGSGSLLVYPRLWGKSSTRTNSGPLTTKPSNVVVSYSSSAILLSGYHTETSIPRQLKSWLGWVVSYGGCTAGKVNHSVRDHTCSARPAAIAGVHGCQ